MYEFDEDTAVERVDAGTYRARITDRWSIGQVPNGGSVMAIATRALGRAVEAPDPLAVTAHFVRPALAGDADVMVEIVKLGKSFTTARARLVQAGSERLAVLATFGDLSRAAGPTHVEGAPPDAPRGDDAPHAERPLGSLPRSPSASRCVPAESLVHAGERSERAENRGRVRFADGRPPDVSCSCSSLMRYRPRCSTS
jgi:acyl-CoA thioesterase